jgi:hypothetical protein
MEFRYIQFHDGIIDEEKFAAKQADEFPLWWIGKYPADQGGHSTISSLSKNDLRVSVNTDPDFEDFVIEIENGSKEVKEKIQKFLNDLVISKIT